MNFVDDVDCSVPKFYDVDVRHGDPISASLSAHDEYVAPCTLSQMQGVWARATTHSNLSSTSRSAPPDRRRMRALIAAPAAQLVKRRLHVGPPAPDQQTFQRAMNAVWEVACGVHGMQVRLTQDRDLIELTACCNDALTIAEDLARAAFQGGPTAD